MDTLKRYKLGEIAEIAGGELDGDPEVIITSCAGFDAAEPGSLTFAEDKRRLARADEGEAAAIIVPEGTKRGCKPLVVAANPRLAFAKVLALFAPPHGVAKGIHPTAVLGAGVSLGNDVCVGPYVTVGDNTRIGDGVVLFPQVCIGSDVEIGDECVFYPRVTVMANVSIGRRCVLHAGAVIGADGFGYVLSAGKHVKIPQIGRIEIGDDVEVGACSCIDRATTGVTRIGSGTKIDNLVQIAHNCSIGENCIIVSQTGLSGSATLEDYVVLGGQVGVNGHITIGQASQIGAQSGVLGDIPPNSVLWGTPARPKRETMESMAYVSRLPETLKDLKRRLEKLEEKG
jgi:UDP-3-O-[3-hydroxymyristoyl] glucosamine N-acyltransferase